MPVFEREIKETTTTVEEVEVDAPRELEDEYGEPVAEEWVPDSGGVGGKDEPGYSEVYYEVYTDDDDPGVLVFVSYMDRGDGWVSEPVERRDVGDIAPGF